MDILFGHPEKHGFDALGAEDKVLVLAAVMSKVAISSLASRDDEIQIAAMVGRYLGTATIEDRKGMLTALCRRIHQARTQHWRN